MILVRSAPENAAAACYISCVSLPMEARTMQTQNRILDDLARVASSAIGVAAGMREELEVRLREQFERVLSRMDLVTREEFDAVRAMAAKARDEQEALTARVAALEAALAKAGPKAAPKAARKTAQKTVKSAAKRAASKRAKTTGPKTPSAE